VAQVKVAEHILTGHKVAIKILNRRKIQAMDMEEKGEQLQGSCGGGPARAVAGNTKDRVAQLGMCTSCCVALRQS
jgi:hypothetical protein